jgi:hypothetical protein
MSHHGTECLKRLSRQVNPLLERVATEDIGPVAMEAFERVTEA